MEKQKPYGTVLIKAAVILDFIAENAEVTLQEIALGTQMTNSTTLKILDTLQLIGYVKKSSQKTYTLGSKLIRYANQNLEETDLIELTLPYLETLQEKIDETIHLGVVSNQEILYVNKLEAKNQTIRMSSKIGITRPLYSSAMGKAVLAEYSEAQYQDYLAQHDLLAYTPQTITNPLKLASELEQVRSKQVAYDDEEMEKDIFCIGAAIKQQGETLGAFSVSMPKYRVTPATEAKIVQVVKETKKLIEAALMNSLKK
ncbi:IclR family KDG regulon transcriptional repressor [Enterococcus sp. PF1-24]|uniref:IclR family transcriptional regulator n=1 Tax=unclassified Enterococcus TaxID=2608891 RepID=UPI002475DD71|nr:MULTISPECIES: IclR family transcriptional regulator [unclassified Enterococcus]MDH6363982.1 IclR family KDG regulon transcriptional repressor [Enterococcus sp. PFB1-1]MDH6401083.1 IclR family KDG regulon transcriptional repressor [Enterococcus sp. PF1-24]